MQWLVTDQLGGIRLESLGELAQSGHARLDLVALDPGNRRRGDAARVLRGVGTRHGGSGAMVEAVTPVGEISTFDQLADEILPFSRAELRDIRV
jgi:hypothetical protein